MSDDPNAIRENIAETRERLSSTIEEIGERLNPQTLKDNVKDSIREATIGRVNTMARNAAESVSRTTTGVTDTIRDNPIPAAMVAVGIGWMIWNARANSRSSTSSNYALRSRDAYDIGYGDEYGAAYTGEFGQPYGSQPEGTIDRARQQASRIAGNVKERARGVSDSVAHSASDVAERAREMSGQAAQRARQVAGTVADTTRRQAGRVEDSFHENPLVMGAVAMAIGLAAGLAVPVSDREVRLMGDARDGVVDRAKEMAGDVREKAERVVSRVADDAKQAVREEGLTMS